MAIVYVTSNRMRKDSVTKELKPIVDLRPAEQFGELRAVFDHEMDPESGHDLKEAGQRLWEFDQQYDYILPNGSPLATLTTGLLLKDKLNIYEPLRVLMWDKMKMRYTVQEVRLGY
jgi:hypothetical protein